MILGRSPNLVIGFATAVLSVVQITHLGGFDLSADGLAAVTGLIGAAVALVANSGTIQIAAGKAAADRAAKS